MSAFAPPLAPRLPRAPRPPLERGVFRPSSSPTGPGGISFADQCAAFLERYRGGFEDRIWETDCRGSEGGRRLKRHRQPSLEEARAELAPERVRPLLARGDFAAVVGSLAKVLKATNLVPVGQAERLGRLEGPGLEPVARALYAHIYGPQEAEGEAFERFVRSLSGVVPNLQGAWRFVTAPRALVAPGQHVCVDPGKFALQARLLGAQIPSASRPTWEDYRRYRELALDVDQRLRLAELSPRDLVDVLDFMYATLSPRARGTLAGAAERRASAGRAAARGVA